MRKKEIVLIGGGGHCKACISVIEAGNKFKIVGIVDVREKLNEKILDYRVLADDGDLARLIHEYHYVLITIGQLGNPGKRIEKYEHLKRLGAELPAIISPSATVSKYSRIEEGSIVMSNAFIGSEARIGVNCIINTGVIIEHETNIGNHCHISTGSIVNGQCVIGDGTFIGSNSVVINNAQIAANTVIGAGAVIASDCLSAGTYVGVPARKIK